MKWRLKRGVRAGNGRVRGSSNMRKNGRNSLKSDRVRDMLVVSCFLGRDNHQYEQGRYAFIYVVRLSVLELERVCRGITHPIGCAFWKFREDSFRPGWHRVYSGKRAPVEHQSSTVSLQTTHMTSDGGRATLFVSPNILLASPLLLRPIATKLSL